MVAKILEVSCTYDQLNLASLCGYEFLVRRAQLIIAAHAHSVDNPVYEGSEYFMAIGDTDEGVAPMLSRSVQQRMTQKNKILEAQLKTRELKVAPVKKPGKDGGKGAA